MTEHEHVAGQTLKTRRRRQPRTRITGLVYPESRENHVAPRVTSLLILTCLVAAAQMKDFEGYKDPALFTRMPHYFLSTKDSVVETPFDAFEFPVKNGTQRVEGRHLHYTYDFDESAGTSPGFLQIVRNYQAAAKKIGGEILSDSVRQTTIRIAKNGQETWVAMEAFNEGRGYELNI